MRRAADDAIIDFDERSSLRRATILIALAAHGDSFSLLRPPLAACRRFAANMPLLDAIIEARPGLRRRQRHMPGRIIISERQVSRHQLQLTAHHALAPPRLFSRGGDRVATIDERALDAPRRFLLPPSSHMTAFHYASRRAMPTAMPPPARFLTNNTAYRERRFAHGLSARRILQRTADDIEAMPLSAAEH